MKAKTSFNKVRYAFGSKTHSDPIFIYGILHRSGTNYLRNLVCLHPDCDFNGPVWEDWLISRSDLLVKYAKSTYGNWDPAWNVQKKLGGVELLCECLGNGLISFLNMQAGNRKIVSFVDEFKMEGKCPRRLVTKTPCVKNIDLFFKLFPHSHLLIVVRDGRSVVESGVRSFQWDYEAKFREWNYYAKLIHKFEEKNKNGNRKFLIVRYEDVYTNLENQMKKILTFLDLDPEKYDLQKAKNLYVSGSSDLSKKEKKNVHWRSIEKTADFNPVKRFRDWDRGLHERFNWIAGNMLNSFGYQKEIYYGKKCIWIIKNILMDIKWELKMVKQRFKKSVNRF
jgi:hypothetical protein